MISYSFLHVHKDISNWCPPKILRTAIIWHAASSISFTTCPILQMSLPTIFSLNHRAFKRTVKGLFPQKCRPSKSFAVHLPLLFLWAIQQKGILFLVYVENFSWTKQQLIIITWVYAQSNVNFAIKRYFHMLKFFFIYQQRYLDIGMISDFGNQPTKNWDILTCVYCIFTKYNWG